MLSNGPSRSSLPLATQLSATPPASTALRSPVVRAAWRAMRITISSVTTWIDAARSSSRWVISDSGERGGPSKRSANRRLVIVSPDR